MNKRICNCWSTDRTGGFQTPKGNSLFVMMSDAKHSYLNMQIRGTLGAFLSSKSKLVASRLALSFASNELK